MDSKTAPASEKDIAKLVREANRSEIHRQTGIDLSHVSRVLSGKRSASSSNLHDIARVLGCTMDELYRYLSSLRRNRRRVRATAAA